MGSRLGVLKGTVMRLGLSMEDYLALLENGHKYCWKCRTWKPLASFNIDRSRPDGHKAICRCCSRVAKRRSFLPGPPDSRTGYLAVEAVRAAIRCGELPRADEVACAHCGQQARHYHHRNGYGQEALLDVIPLCVSCHKKEHWSG